MKKLLGLFLVAGAAFSLTACFDKEVDEPDTNEPTPEDPETPENPETPEIPDTPERPEFPELPEVEDNYWTQTDWCKTDIFRAKDTKNYQQYAAAPDYTEMLPHYSIQGFAVDGYFEGNAAKGINADAFKNISETDSARYKKVTTAKQFVDALESFRTKTDSKPGTVIIEVANDLNLGYNCVAKEYQAAGATIPSLFRDKSSAYGVNPIAKQTGMSYTEIKTKSDLLIYSKNGSRLAYGTFIIKDKAKNIAMRNLSFDGAFEWDEATKGDYDKNDWDYITVDGSTVNGVWIDHCTFGKAYDGLIDVKSGATNVSITWNKFLSASDGNDPYVNSQFQYLEAYKEKFSMYNYFRSKGVTMEDMIKIYGSQKKGHLIGANSASSITASTSVTNAKHHVTIANNYYQDLQDRLPRLRGGNAHVYNVFYDATGIYEANQMIASKYASVSGGNYKWGATNQALVTTENGAVLFENVHLKNVKTAVKNNQVNSDPNSFYNGKYKVVNSVYELQGEKYIENTATNQKYFIGNVQPEMTFSWNGFAQLPYTYRLLPISQVANTLLNDTYGAGSGVLQFSASQWQTFNY